jgi:malonyl-CoA/methylmalonyl-CoA synthetase
MFLDALRDFSLSHPDKTAIEFIDNNFVTTDIISYGRLEATVQRTMALLQSKGVVEGDRVAIQLPKCLAFVYLHLAVMRLGGISLPLNPGYPPHELAYFLTDAEAKLFFADTAVRDTVMAAAALAPALQEAILLDCRTGDAFLALLPDRGETPALDLVAALSPEQTCLMIYTSGTTGRPKGAELTHGNVTSNLASLHEAWGWREDDLLLHVLPIFHVHGLVVAMHGSLHAGATMLMPSRFDPARTLALLEERRCTVFMAVPTIHRRLVDAPNARTVNLGHMRLLTSGSDRLPDDLFAQFREIFGHTLLERYGMSETIMNLSNPLAGERRVGSVGLPLPGVEVRIVDPASEEPLADNEVGEVQVRGPNVCKGYWRQPEKSAAAFTPDGWLRTGDLGLREPDGYFTLKGRSKDLIISGGYNVYPPEVELVLAEHPAVEASAVIGCPDNEWGETVTAVVVLRKDATISEQALIAYCRSQLVNYKSPRRIVISESLPRNALGKVQKMELRKLFCE